MQPPPGSTSPKNWTGGKICGLAPLRVLNSNYDATRMAAAPSHNMKGTICWTKE